MELGPEQLLAVSALASGTGCDDTDGDGPAEGDAVRAAEVVGVLETSAPV
jgi:hypothetical protein